MLGRLREIFLGNLKNKFVALLFASTIWYVAYQSELRQETVKTRVRLVPRPEGRVLVDSMVRLGENETAPFSREVLLSVNGTRKEIDKFQELLPGIIQIEVRSPGDQGFESGVHRFSQDDLDFLGFTLAKVERFEPPAVEFHLDDRSERRVKVEVLTPSRPDLVEEAALATPSEVVLTGPGSLLESARVVARIDLPEGETEFRGKAAIEVIPDELDGFPLGSLVRVEGPEEVEVNVRMTVRESTLEEKSVRLRFLLPPVNFPLEIQFNERLIPLVFRGPEREIERLRQEIQKPDFFVAVPVLEAGLSPEKEHGFTFTEQDLILKGFSQVIEVLQHPDRANKGPWSCTIRPVQPANE